MQKISQEAIITKNKNVKVFGYGCIRQDLKSDSNLMSDNDKYGRTCKDSFYKPPYPKKVIRE